MKPTKQAGDASSSEPAANHSAFIDVEPTKHDIDASSSEPAANHSASQTEFGLGASLPQAPAALDTRLQAMQLGDSSSSRQRPRSTGPTSLPLPQLSPPQFQPQQGRQRYSVGETSSGAAYAWPVSDIRGCTALDPAFAVGYDGPFAPSYPSVAQWWPSTPSFSSVPDGRIARSLRYDTSAIPLLHRAQDLALLMSQETSGDVIRELEKGNEEVRLCVFHMVASAVHTMMESSEGHAVFVALLRASEHRLENLQDIVSAACDGRARLMRLMEHGHGEAALKELIRVAAPYHRLYEPLIARLLSAEWMVEESKGVVLLDHLFTTMSPAAWSIIINFAIINFDAMSLSMPGSMCLIKCFKAAAVANEGKLGHLEDIVLRQTSYLAKGRYSNHFLQGVLELGSDSLKEAIVERVLEDLVSLSMHWPGNYVVQRCFLPTGSRRVLLLERVFTAFRGLGDDQLLELVLGRYANYVVRRLLREGKNPFPEETMELAQRIQDLVVVEALEGHNYHTYASLVMKVATEVLSQQQPH